MSPLRSRRSKRGLRSHPWQFDRGLSDTAASKALVQRLELLIASGGDVSEIAAGRPDRNFDRPALSNCQAVGACAEMPGWWLDWPVESSTTRPGSAPFRASRASQPGGYGCCPVAASNGGLAGS